MFGFPFLFPLESLLFVGGRFLDMIVLDAILPIGRERVGWFIKRAGMLRLIRGLLIMMGVTVFLMTSLLIAVVATPTLALVGLATLLGLEASLLLCPLMECRGEVFERRD